MDEEIIAEAAAVVEALQELHMLLRDRVADRRKRFRVARSARPRRIDAIAPEAFRSAELAPLGDQLCLASKDPEQHFLVIPEKEDCSDARIACKFEDARSPARSLGPRSIRSPTKTSSTLRALRLLNVGMDLAEQLLEKVEAAMNVADRIGSPPACARRTAVPSLSEIEHPVLAQNRHWTAQSVRAQYRSVAKPLVNC